MILAIQSLALSCCQARPREEFRRGGPRLPRGRSPDASHVYFLEFPTSPYHARPPAPPTPDVNREVVRGHRAGCPGRLCPGEHISRSGIVGCDGTSAGLGWHNSPQHVIANLELHCFPETWPTQPPAFPQLLGFLTGASQSVERGRAEEPLPSLHFARVYRKFPHKLLNVRMADTKPPAHGTARRLSGLLVLKPLPHQAFDYARLLIAAPRPWRSPTGSSFSEVLP